MTMPRQGFLAIWTDIDPENFEEYRRWLSREHIGQRIFGTGFLSARVHEALDDAYSHFIIYATEGPAVLKSQSYLEVLNNPTSWTQQMMPLLRRFDRAAGSQLLKLGDGAGSYAYAAKLSVGEDDHSLDALAGFLPSLMKIDGVVAARVFEVEREATDLRTVEKKIRAVEEGAFSHLVLVEATGAERLSAIADGFESLARQELANASVQARKFKSVYSLHPFDREHAFSRDQLA